jgi:hypothetical protein
MTPTLDPHGHARRLARAAVAYRHACGCSGRRDAAGETPVLVALALAELGAGVDALAAPPADPDDSGAE